MDARSRDPRILSTRRQAMLAMVAATSSVSAQSEPYPSRAIKIVSAFPAGGAADLNTRILAEAMSDRIKQPVTVEYRPGAAGSIGTAQFSKMRPDGYTLLLAPQQIVTNYYLYESKIHPLNNLLPVSLWSSYAYILVASAASGFTSVGELVRKAKESPNKFNIARNRGSRFRRGTGGQVLDAEDRHQAHGNSLFRRGRDNQGRSVGNG